MGAREGPATGAPVGGRPGRQRCLDCEGALPVLQLPAVEVARLAVETRSDVLPAEEDVARRLHQPLARDDPLAAVGVLALAHEPLQHGRLRFLELEEQRIGVVDPEEERDPGARADAPDSDDLAGEIDEPELLQQMAAIRLEGAAIRPDDAVDLLLDRVRIVGRGRARRSGRSGEGH